MSALYSGSLVPLAILVWPLVLALVPAVPAARAHAVRLLPLAPLPALGFALAGAPGQTLIPDLVLGVRLQAVPGGALFLGMTAAVWTVAGWQAARTMARGTHAAVFSGFWCLTLAGNLGVFLAGDIATFYLAFAAVSLAAWFLVVHDRTDSAVAAGRFYIVLAVLGEAALLVGLMIGAAAADSLLIGDVRAGLALAPLGGLGSALLVIGFGIKAGMVPLHVWLPVAHPAAPVPGSAVLSGAIVKAGLIGMILLVPLEAIWGEVLIVAGVLGAFGAALRGLTQRNPKAVLAYSTVSQMGLMLALAGSGSGVVAFYALHHGLAKAALFLSVGALGLAAGTGRHRVALGLAGLVALSVAGLPLSGGALVKAAAKAEMGAGAALVLTLTGVTTTMVLAWFLTLAAQPDPARAKAPPPAPGFWPVWAGIAVLGALALGLPWLLWADATTLSPGYATRGRALSEALWPILAGLALFALIRNRLRAFDTAGATAQMRWRWPLPDLTPPGLSGRHAGRLMLRLLLRSRRAERYLLRWTAAGPLLFGGALALALLTG